MQGIWSDYAYSSRLEYYDLYRWKSNSAFMNADGERTVDDSLKTYLEVALRPDEMKVCMFVIYERKHMSYQISQSTFLSHP